MKPTTRAKAATPTAQHTTTHRSTRAAALAAPLLAAFLLSGCSSEDATTTASESSSPTSTTASESSTAKTTSSEAPSSSTKPQPTRAEGSSAQGTSTAPDQSRKPAKPEGEASSAEKKPATNAAPANAQAGDYCGQVKTRDSSQPGEPIVTKKVYAVAGGTDCAAGLKAMQGYADGIPYDPFEHGNAQIVSIPGGSCSAPTAASAQETNTSMKCSGTFGEVKVPRNG